MIINSLLIMHMIKYNFSIIITKSIHLSSSTSLGVGSQGQQSQQRYPDFPGPGHIFQLIQQNPKLCPRYFLGSFPRGTCLEHLSREASRWATSDGPYQCERAAAPPRWPSPSTQPPYRENSFWSLVSVILLFWSLPKFHDHWWGWERTVHRLQYRELFHLAELLPHDDLYSNCITADIAWLHLSMLYSLFTSLGNKIWRCLNSSTSDRVSLPTWRGQTTFFLVKNHGIGLGGADSYPSHVIHTWL